jgi:hypothetical protein
MYDFQNSNNAHKHKKTRHKAVHVSRQYTCPFPNQALRYEDIGEIHAFLYSKLGGCKWLATRSSRFSGKNLFPIPAGGNTEPVYTLWGK